MQEVGCTEGYRIQEQTINQFVSAKFQYQGYEKWQDNAVPKGPYEIDQQNRKYA